jgi:hypothetical protein
MEGVQYLHFVKEHDIAKLWSELEAAGVVILDMYHTETEIWIGIPADAPQEMIDAVNTVVANHDPTPLPPPPTPDEIVIQELQAATTLDEVKAALIKRFQANLPQQ